MTEIFFPFIIGLIGSFVGSFLSVVIFRVPRKQSIVYPRSACPTCGKTLGPVDLIPVMSYVASLGRCRHCHVRIPLRYPLIEITTALLLSVVYVHTAHLTEFITWSTFISFLLVMFIIDMDHMILPNRINAFGLIAALLLTALGWTDITLIQSLIGAVVGFGTILVIILLSKGGMGAGDGKFLAVIGAFLGPLGTVCTLFIASFIGASVGICLILSGRRKREDPLPFGPFLALGAVIALVLQLHISIEIIL